MPIDRDLDDFLQDWPYDPHTVSARLVRASNGRDVLQMRVDLGVLQMEVAGRPDGTRPGGAETYLDLLIRETFRDSGPVELNDRQLEEIDLEFSQFYHRRICWMAVREFDRAVADADHTLALMGFLDRYIADDHWQRDQTEQQGLVLFHRTQAAALAHLEKKDAEAAIEEINQGLERIEQLGQPLKDTANVKQMSSQLHDLQDWVRDHYQVDRTLNEQLADAVAAEEYERAAKLRDELARRNPRA